jgi:ferrochelatase
MRPLTENRRTPAYDALLIVAFGGPEGPDDVGPFLDRVLRNRRVPPERRREVEEHYLRFGGVSPINAQMRALQAAVQTELDRAGRPMPVVVGNRNWHPLLSDVLPEMAIAGHRSVLALFTSPYSSYSSCRQYWEDIAAAQTGAATRVRIEKLRAYYNHPLFVQACADRLGEALHRLESSAMPSSPAAPHVIFAAHSIPLAMARGCAYESQLRETAALVAAEARVASWELAFQSRSGPPTQPWLEPDVLDRVASAGHAGRRQLVLAPIGFISDHMEVVYDLDVEAAEAAAAGGIALARAQTVGTHPAFVRMVSQLVAESVNRGPEWTHPPGAVTMTCPSDCCPIGA